MGGSSGGVSAYFGRPGVLFGFRFLLVHPDRERADPGMFLTAIPNRRAGDKFLAGRGLVKFRILDVDTDANTEQNPAGLSGVFTVEELARG